jgi:acyl carrier protein
MPASSIVAISPISKVLNRGMTRNEMLRHLEALIEEPPDSLLATDRLSDLPGWDSITILKFIRKVDATCGFRLKAEDILGCATVDDLMVLLKL